MSALFEPFRLGALGLPDSIVMAPLGRARAHVDTREPLPRASTCYAQRATAGLIVSEATHVSVESVGRPGTAAIQSNGQVEAWRRVTDAVHAAGGRIFQQRFHLYRKADPTRTPWNAADPSTYYSGGDEGYIDYPFLDAADSGVTKTL